MKPAYSSFIFLFIYPFFCASAKIDSELMGFHERCLKQSEIQACDYAVKAFNGQEKPEFALEVSEKMCEMNAMNCSQSYFSARQISPKAANELVKKMELRCSKNIEYCDILANIYEERKQFPLALETAKKYYDKFHKGSYARLAYQQGKDKTPAFEEALSTCREDNSNCSFSLRYLPDHPQYQELLVHAENHCKNESMSSYGATDCTIVGTIYYKKSNFTKAFEFWTYDCAKNQIACMLVLGSDKATPTLKLKAMIDFCNYSGQAHEATMSNLENKHCAKFKTTKKIPQEMFTSGERSLKSFIDEQK